MKSRLILGLCLLAQSSLSLPAAQFIWHPGEDAEDSPFVDMGRLLAPSPHFRGTEFPTPPQQGQPWTPPKTQLPDVALDAMKALFDEGLVDPRGCDYREIKVAVGNCWSGDSGVATTHGWILPGKESFAICWNGLVYPVVSAGPAADLRADILSLLVADREQLKEQGFVEVGPMAAPGTKPTYTLYPVHAHASVTERQGVSYKSMLPFKAVLLLRLGQGDLAENVWSQWYDTRNEDPSKDPYLWLASAWAWAAFDRAVDAHMRGDDNLALVSARDLIPIQTAVEAEAARRNFTLAGHEKTYLNFLGQLPDLVADSQRRLAEPAYTPVLAMENPPKGAERIAGLIRDLELVSARQMQEPGGVSIGQDPIVQALIQEGDPAVEPLLKCLDDDPRLIRSVQFWRDNSTDRTILGVYEAAYVAVATILQTDFFGITSTGDNLTKRGPEERREITAKIRAYWDKYGKLTLPQRWYQTLGDDQAAPEQWREAVANIVQLSDVTVTAGSSYMGGSISTPPRQPGQTPPMRGEPLRNLTGPSVSDLLIRRLHAAEQKLDPKAKEDAWNASMAVADQVARALADWDGRNQLAELRDYSAKLQEIFDGPDTHGHAMIRPMAAMFEKRAEAGDASALDEYAKWLGATTGHGLSDEEARDLLRVAWLHPNSPVIQQTISTLFSEKGTWSHVLNLDGDLQHTIRSIFTSPLVGLEGFRKELLRGLQDKAQVGSITIRNGGAGIDPPGRWGWSVERGAPLLPPDGSSVSFRTCDFYAFLLETLPGAPRCELYWPEANRDKAVAQTIDYLRNYGDRLQYGPDQIDDGDNWWGPSPPINILGPFGRSLARLRFPALDHPATPEDLRQHRAIFALEGERRLWKLSKIPIEVLWTTLKDEPRPSFSSVGADGKLIIYYDTDGVAWQAEEVMINGKWKRFLGVVTKHRVARVPASDVEFILPGFWSRMPHGFDCLLATPEDPKSWRGCYTYEPVLQGQPILATLAVRNRSGLDQTLPANLFRDTTDAQTLPDGVKLTLLYSEKMPPKRKPDGGFPQPNEMGPWTEIPIRAGSYPTPSSAGDAKTVTVLASTAERTLFKIDLRDFFDVSRPGSYRLAADIQRPDALVGKPAETSFTIVAAH